MRFIQQADIPAKSLSLRSSDALEVHDRKRESEPAPSRAGHEVSLELKLTSDQVAALKHLLGRHGKLTVKPSRQAVPTGVEDEKSSHARRQIFAKLAKDQPASRSGDSYGYLHRAKRNKGKARPAPARIDPGDTRSKEAGKAELAPTAPASPDEGRRSTMKPGTEREVKKDEPKAERHRRAERDRESSRGGEPVRSPADDSGAKKAPNRELVEIVTGKKPPKRGAFFGRRAAEEAQPEEAATRTGPAPDVHYWLLVIRTR
jgi:hypothetical protein